MNRDWTDFARHVLLPGRPRLPEARTAVIGMTDVREAWEALVSRDPTGAATARWQTRPRR